MQAMLQVEPPPSQAQGHEVSGSDIRPCGGCRHDQAPSTVIDLRYRTPNQSRFPAEPSQRLRIRWRQNDRVGLEVFDMVVSQALRHFQPMPVLRKKMNRLSWQSTRDRAQQAYVRWYVMQSYPRGLDDDDHGKA